MASRLFRNCHNLLASGWILAVTAASHYPRTLQIHTSAFQLTCALLCTHVWSFIHTFAPLQYTCLLLYAHRCSFMHRSTRVACCLHGPSGGSEQALTDSPFAANSLHQEPPVGWSTGQTSFSPHWWVAAIRVAISHSWGSLLAARGWPGQRHQAKRGVPSSIWQPLDNLPSLLLAFSIGL